MRRRYAVMTFVLVLALAIGQASAWSRMRRRRIPGFHATKRLPNSMVAGSTYETSFMFRNPKRQKAQMTIVLRIKEEDSVIGFGEFFVEGTLHTWVSGSRRRFRHYHIDLSFAETTGGVFRLEGEPLKPKSFNYVTLKISSVPNLLPRTYTFTLNVAVRYGQK